MSLCILVSERQKPCRVRLDTFTYDQRPERLINPATINNISSLTSFKMDVNLSVLVYLAHCDRTQIF